LTHVPSRFHLSKEERTERIGGTSAGSRRHWQPVRCLESSALTIARRSMSVRRPPFGDVAWRVARWRPSAHRSDWLHPVSDRIDAHGAASQSAPHQNGMFTIMIPQIRVSDRPLKEGYTESAYPAPGLTFTAFSPAVGPTVIICPCHCKAAWTAEWLHQWFT